MFVLSFLIFICLFYLFFYFPTKWLKIERQRHNLKINKKIIQISDLHIKNLRVPLKNIQYIIKKEKPDYVFLTGDLVDKKEKELKKLEKLLSLIKQTKTETIAILGNHDYLLKDISLLVNLLEKYDVKVLRNEFIEKEDFIIVGIDDLDSGYSDLNKSFNFENKKNKKTIVLAHNPNIIEHIKEKFDYMLSGHLHGKQINVPFLFKFKDMGDLPKKGIYKGLNKSELGSFYISKGISQTKYNVRFLVRSEITIHEI